MSRDSLERHQVWCYLGAVLLGLVVGSAWSGLGPTAEALVWPVLAVLLYATFTQVPLVSIPAAFTDGRFLVTALVGNFVLVPIVVWGLVQLVPDDEVLRLGLLLVLLVPCTDWFITFTQLGRGDAPRAIALTPITLIVQLLLAVVILLIATAHVGEVRESLDVLPVVLAVSVAYLVAALALAKGLGSATRLPAAQSRTLAFSLGTRNSFIVLPFALSLPSGWEVAAIVVVMQSLVELFGMVFYLWFVPRILFPDNGARAAPVRRG